MKEMTYTLKELCQELNLSKGWVDKIEKLFGFSSGASGTPGMKSTYSFETYNFFRKIAVLRSLGFNLDYIKALYDLENRIQNLIPLFQKEGAEIRKLREKGKETKFTLIFFYLIDSFYYPSGCTEIDYLMFEKGLRDKQKEAVELNNLFSKHKTILKGIYYRVERQQDFLGTWAKRLRGVFSEERKRT